MKIRNKLTVLVAAFSLIPFTIVGLVLLDQSRAALSDQVYARLVHIRDSKQAQLERYAHKIRSDAAFLSRSSNTEAALKAFSSMPGRGPKDKSGKRRPEGLEYDVWFRRFVEEYGYEDLLLVTRAGDIVYSVRQEDDLGHNVIDGTLKDSGLGQDFQRRADEGRMDGLRALWAA